MNGSSPVEEATREPSYCVEDRRTEGSLDDSKSSLNDDHDIDVENISEVDDDNIDDEDDAYPTNMDSSSWSSQESSYTQSKSSPPLSPNPESVGLATNETNQPSGNPNQIISSSQSFDKLPTTIASSKVNTDDGNHRSAPIVVNGKKYYRKSK